MEHSPSSDYYVENVRNNDAILLSFFPGLHNALKTKLHGQHLVQDVVEKHLKSHLAKVHPTKALVLSFHGWTGTGKNFVSKLIAENLFQKGMNSDFVKLFICSYDFLLHDEASIQQYKVFVHLVCLIKEEKKCYYIFSFNRRKKFNQKFETTCLDAVLRYLSSTKWIKPHLVFLMQSSHSLIFIRKLMA